MLSSNSHKKRTMSTTNTRTQLPHLITSQLPSIGSRQIVNKQLFNRNTSAMTPQKQKLAKRQRMVTQILKSARSRQSSTSKYMQNSKHIEKTLQIQIQEIMQLFKDINRLREREGVISLREQGEDDYYFSSQEVPYSAQLHIMNEQICHIKGKIQERMDKLFKMAKYYPKIRQMIQFMLENTSKESLQQNIRFGKIAAMKAQRRLIVSTQEELQKIQKISMKCKQL